MLELKLKRTSSTPYQTLGSLEVYDIHKVEGKYSADFIFGCATLEPPVRLDESKIKGKTAIPFGLYNIGLMTYETPMNKRYGDMFGGKHKGMIHIKDVKDFEQVYIHIGNFTNDSKGCILVGKEHKPSYMDTNQMLIDSRKIYIVLYDLILKRLANNEFVSLLITD